MNIGFAQMCITPALPVQLSGFIEKRKAESVLDDLYVKAVVYQRENEWYGILAYDLIAIDALLMDQVKQGMKELNLKEEQFLFTATHTHSGPGGILETRNGILKPAADIFIKTDLDLIAYIAEKSLQALKKAMENCRETMIAYAESTLPHVGNNRNSRDFKGNDDIAAVFLKQENGQKAVILNFACHPTILNYSNEAISADFPGAIAACMKQHGYDVCMYLNGSCGDISTRFTRRSSEADELMRYGRMFEETLLEMEKHAQWIDDIHDVTIVHDVCRMELKCADSVEKARKELDACEKRLQEARQHGICGASLRLMESYKEGAQSNLSLAQNPYPMTYYDVPVMFVKIHQHIAVCVPGELFSELSNPLQNTRVHFIGYANGYMGYFADETAYDRFYYEALSSPFKKGQSERLMMFVKQAIQRLLKKGELI